MNESEWRELENALHEINNMLNAISMQSELAMMHATQGNTDQVQSAIAVVMKSCRSCSTISHDLQARLFPGDS